MNRAELIAFEDDIAALFNAGKIPYPVHLSDGNEDQLIEIFEDISHQDWIFGSWRSHYHCLLKGVAPDKLKAAILRGESIALSFPEHRVLCSAIVGGIIPIALGTAMGIKRAGTAERVYCFMGEMTAETGIAHECMKYAYNHDLPIFWVVEDNGLSVCTDTEETWGRLSVWWDQEGVTHYRYDSKYPHAGAGKRIQF